MRRQMRQKLTILLALGSVGAIAFVASPASASRGSGGGDAVRRSGSCTGVSNWKLKARHRDGRTETEFEVDQNRNGVRWHFRIRLNGTTVAEGNRRTKAPSGSFSVERQIGDPAGKDRITAIATRRGETCRGTLQI